MVFSYTPNVNAKKDASKNNKDKKEEETKECKTVEEGKNAKPWMSAL